MASHSEETPDIHQNLGDRTAPVAKLRLEWVYGYRSANCRNNVHLTDNGDLVYFSAAVAIVQNIQEKDNYRQRFFLGHDGHIISSCLHPDKIIVATGQMGKTAQICVWNSHEPVKLESLLQGHTDGVGAMSFSADGEKLASVGIDSDNTIKIWKWRQGKVLATVSGHIERVFDICYYGDQVITCGVKHIRFWTLLGNTLQYKEGTFGKLEAQTLLCIGHFLEPNQKNTDRNNDQDISCFTGAINGYIYVWKKNKIEKFIPGIDGSTIYSLDINANGFITSSKDGLVQFWNRDFTPTGQSIQIPSALHDVGGVSVCSVTSHHDYCVVGTRDCEIYGFHLNGNMEIENLVRGHHDDGLYALACHPKKNLFATGGDDCLLRFWNADRKSSMGFYITPFAQATPPPGIRSISFSHDGVHIAVGFENGLIEIYKTPADHPVGNRIEPVQVIHDRLDSISVLRFSCEGKYLAVGCIDGNFDLYDVSNKYRHLSFKDDHHDSSISNIDWTEDDKYFQFTREHKLSFTYKMPNMTPVLNQEEEAISNWSSMTNFKHKVVKGIWNKFAEKTDIVTIEANSMAGVIAAGDEQGLVKLFRYPSERRGAHFKKYLGHASRIASIHFLHDTSGVISIGLNDRTIMQWKYSPVSDSIAPMTIQMKKSAPLSAGVSTGDSIMPDVEDLAVEEQHALQTAQHAGTYLDSDSEDSDSDLSGGEIDSDIEKERQYTYDRTLYRDDYQKLKKTQKVKLPPGEKRNKQPDGGLKLNYAFGYRGYDCRDNVFCLKSGEIVYHVAALGIVLNTEQNQQRFYNVHTDDILCLAVSPDMTLVATGQIGRDPPVHVWDPISMETRSILKGQHDRGICALGFSRNGKKLASVGLDDYRTIVIWDWKKGEKLASQRGHNDKIFCLRWNLHDDERFVTVGIKHIKFWTLAGGGMVSKQGVFGKQSGKQGKQNQMCVVFGKTADNCYTGGGDGSIYIWFQTSLERKIDDAHNGPVFTITAVQDKGYITGGKDGKVILWDPEIKKKIKVYELSNKNVVPESRGRLTEEPSSIRAATLARRIVVGTRGGEICEIEKDGRIRVAIQGHGEGEMWGLSTHPSRHEICTVSDDKTVRIWSLTEKRMLRFARFDKQLRTCEYSNDGKKIAVGTKDGQFMILVEADLSPIKTVAHRHQEVSDIKFSPDDRYLAVGTHDNFVDIYKLDPATRVGICKANSSYITHIDWDRKGKLIMTNSGDRQQLFYEAPRGTRITSIKTTDVEKMQWATWTGVLGLVCEGIWPPATDITDVNSTDLTTDQTILATADDFGLVKLFDFPVKGKHAKFKRYTGHSAHVTRVRWTHDDSHLVSIGGRDVATLIWNHDHQREIETAPSTTYRTTTTTNGPNAAGNDSIASSIGTRKDHGESDDSDNTDSEEEGYDSDVQHDRAMDYTKRLLINPIRAKNEQMLPKLSNPNRKPIRSKVKPSQKKVYDELAAVKAAFKAGIGLGLLTADRNNAEEDEPGDNDSKHRGRVIDLELDHIHGYRGFDCRDNLFYLADNESIVYPAAGACIIHNLRRATQQFYLDHTDDIISMAVHNGEDGNIVASGQIGENPTIHVWDPKTRKTLSVLSGKHKKGVCSLSFSAKGKLLLSLGVESPYTIAVWRWQEGTNVACTVASEDRVFRALFRTNSDTHFVSVGVKHLKFWSVAGNTLLAKKAIINNASDGTQTTKMQTMLSIAFGPNDRTYTGSMTGYVFIWQFNVLERSVMAHLGPIFSLFSSNNCLVTGAKERRSVGSTRVLEPLKVWSLDMTTKKTLKLDLPQMDVICIRSVCRNNQGKILVGLKTAEIFEIDEKATGNQSQMLAYGHGEGELWGLAPHPSKPIFATGSYDQNLVIWNIESRGLIAKRNMGKEIRSVAFGPDGKLLAAGFKDGQISLFTFSASEKQVIDVFKTRERNSDIICVKFSPDGKYLVASTQNYAIDFFEIQQNRMNRVGYTTHIEDVVLQIDWSTNSQFIRATTACYNALVYRAPSGQELKNRDEIEKIVWHTWTSTVGDDIIGIWPKDVKKDHINCAHAASSTIATGDDNGAVNLYKFPCPEPLAEHKTFYGHSANVTNVRFLANERYLISLGGDDCCVFVWKCISATENEEND